MKYQTERSLKIARNLFPIEYINNRRKQFHFAFGFKKRKLIGIGINQPNEQNKKALNFGNRFGIERYKKFPYLHAEIDLLSKLWGRFHIGNNLSIVVLRINRFGKLQNSKPCSDCGEILRLLDIGNITYSTKNGFIKLVDKQ